MITRNNIEITYEIKGFDGYVFGKDKMLYNLKTGRRLKHTMVNYTKGFYIKGKFFTHKKLRELLIKPVKTECPF